MEVVNVAETDTEDLLADLGAIVSLSTARLYGQRRAKRTTERMLQELQGEDKHETRWGGVSWSMSKVQSGSANW